MLWLLQSAIGSLCTPAFLDSDLISFLVIVLWARFWLNSKYPLFLLHFWTCLFHDFWSLNILVHRECVGHCKETGCVGGKCFQHCNFPSGEKPIDGPWYLQEPLYLRWKQWDCLSDCRYHCMLAREEERQKLGLKPIKYHGKWPFRRVYGIQVHHKIRLIFSYI